MRGVMPGGFDEVFETVLICRLDLPDFSLGSGYNDRSGDVYLIYKFAEYSLDSDRLELRRGADLVAVEPQVLDLLQYIIRNRERVVSKDDLIAHVWNGRIVSDSTLTSRITAARQAVGDSGKEQRLIRTFSRKGLRFVGDVREQQRSDKPDSPTRADVPVENDATRVAAVAPGSPERRQITIMVCEVIDSTVSTRLDPEDLRDVLAACHRRVREVIERYDGFIAEYRTGRIVVYFGYPIAHEHDVERAVRAGLAITTAAADMKFECLNEPIQPRVGIATGLVVVGDTIGAAATGEHAVAGEIPHLAGNLLAIAEPGAVIISASTRRLIGSLFDYQDIDTSHQKGSAVPLEAHRVLREGKIGSRFDALRSVRTQLVGRDEELDLLLRRWRQAKTGEGRVVLVSGEPGIGKSRLMASLQDALQQERHESVSFWCWPHRTQTALHPVITYIEHAAGFEASDSDEAKLEKLETMFSSSHQEATRDIVLFADLLTIPAIGRHSALSISPRRRKELLLERFVAHLVDLASRQPVLIVVEDAHWIDPTSRELFDIIVERVAQLPVLFVMTYRPEFSPPWLGQSHVTALTLNRLGRRESVVMIKEVADGRTLSDDLLAQIVARTDGVPLFIEELTKSVLESSVLPADASAKPPPLAVPATLQASLVARLDRLAPVRAVAQTGAAIGREFTYATLKAVMALSDDELGPLLDRLVASELVHQRGVPPQATYSFKHALVQDAAYQTVLKSQRTKVHARIAEVLEHEFPETAQRNPEVLAYHCTQAQMWEKAIDYWLAAARMALDHSAGVEAQAQVEKGMALLSEITESSVRRQFEGRLYATLGNTFGMTKGFASLDVTNALIACPKASRRKTPSRRIAQRSLRSL